MNNLILSLITLLILAFHLYVKRHIRCGKAKESLCALWCMDSVLSVCGTVLSFLLYHYDFAPILTLRNILLSLAYLILTFLFLVLSPTGPTLLLPKNTLSTEDLLVAEYRFNYTLSLVRSFFLTLLLILPPIIYLLVKRGNFLFTAWSLGEIYGGFYFMVFLILLPMCLRQSLYWLKSLHQPTTESEATLLRKYSMSLHYSKRNLFL